MKGKFITLVLTSDFAAFGVFMHSPPSILDGLTGATPKAKRAAQMAAPLEGNYLFCINPALEPFSDADFRNDLKAFVSGETEVLSDAGLPHMTLSVCETDYPLLCYATALFDSFKVSGRGELHLSVLIENMRREGYEFAVSKAEVLYKYDKNGKKLEPMELAYIDVPDEFTGAVISKLQQRKGELRNMGSIAGGYTRLEFHIPARGLIGYRGEFMTDTKGNGILNWRRKGTAKRLHADRLRLLDPHGCRKQDGGRESQRKARKY